MDLGSSPNYSPLNDYTSECILMLSLRNRCLAMLAIVHISVLLQCRCSRVPKSASKMQCSSDHQIGIVVVLLKARHELPTNPSSKIKVAGVTGVSKTQIIVGLLFIQVAQANLPRLPPPPEPSLPWPKFPMSKKSPRLIFLFCPAPLPIVVDVLECLTEVCRGRAARGTANPES